MKKNIIIALGAVLVVAIAIIAVIRFRDFGSRPEGTADTVELSEVSGLVTEKGYTQEEIEEKLKGELRDNILVSWGEPDGMLSGFWGDIWFLDAEKDKKIILYYDTEGYVENVRIGSVSEELGLTKEDIVMTNPEQVTIPPELIIVCGGEQITALKGTYSWEYKNEDGTCTGIEVDSMHPLESKEYMSDLPLTYSYISAIDAFKAYLQFGIVPDDVEIRYWSTDCWNESTAESKELDIQAETVFEDGKNITSHSAKLLEGNYIYEVVAKWSSSEEYSGTVHYSFYTVMGNYEPISVQE